MPAAFAVTSLHKRFRTRFGRTESVALDFGARGWLFTTSPFTTGRDRATRAGGA